jgi:hypothetical protein
MAKGPKSLDDIFAIKDQEKFCEALCDRVNARWNKLGFDALAPGEKLIVRMNAFVGEINTNGFDGLLYNCTGDWTEEIRDGLLLLGAKKAAKLVERAMGVFPSSEVPKDQGARQDILLSLNGKKKAAYDALMDKLSDEMEQPDVAVNVPALVGQYARANRDQFA